MSHNRIKKANRGERIADLTNRLADHADAIDEVRRVASKTHLAVVVMQRRNHTQRARLAALLEFFALPWWARLIKRVKGEVPWSNLENSGKPSDAKASEAQTGEQSST